MLDELRRPEVYIPVIVGGAGVAALTASWWWPYAKAIAAWLWSKLFAKGPAPTPALPSDPKVSMLFAELRSSLGAIREAKAALDKQEASFLRYMTDLQTAVNGGKAVGP